MPHYATAIPMGCLEDVREAAADFPRHWKETD